MNIFILDHNPCISAQYHVDIHVNKMLIESLQMLASSHYLANSIVSKSDNNFLSFQRDYFKDFPRKTETGEVSPYGLGYINHPCTKWVAASLYNYGWTLQQARALLAEYEFRFRNKHSCAKIVDYFSEKVPNIKTKDFIGFCYCVDDEFKSAEYPYREYYKAKKKYLARWTNREQPFWWE